MIKLFVTFAGATSLAMPLALPLAAYAQPVTGPYVSLEGGTSWMRTERFHFTGAFPLTQHIHYRNDYAGTAAVGYGFGDGIRVEIAGNLYRNTDTRINDIRSRGGTNTYGGMFNVLYDIPLNLPFYPYIGIGGGYEVQHFDSKLKGNEVAADFPPGDTIVVSGAEGAFAYNVILGLSYPIAAVPGLSLTADYKFTSVLRRNNYNHYLTGPVQIEGGATGIDQQFTHTLQFGLRYQLFQPAPPPPPVAAAPVEAPAPAPAKTYLVFFDWNKYDLTPRATQIIAQAAQDSHANNVTTLDVSGYTDTSGTPQYNQRLSEHRAQTVVAQLVLDGVPQPEIAIHAYGETHLLVPTGPGVREPQNRRVVIILQ